MDIKEEEILGKKIYEHWYYVSKGRALLQFIGRRSMVQTVLDVGAGSGVFSRYLLDAGRCEKAICVDPFYKDERSEIYNGKPISFVRSIERKSQELVLMMDVLEHVDNDVALLREYTKDMSDEGRVLITVPAFQFLWSGHDMFLEHKRRYTIKSLENLVASAGLVPVKSRYFFGGLFPVLALIRLFKNFLLQGGMLKAKSDLALCPAWLNVLLITLHDIERITLFRINKVAGLSVFCLCKKKGIDD